jgi:glycosyltransferase involved in cell wall biosynthesis
MKVLWLNAGLLLPLDKGGKLRTWHLMRHLATRHDVTFLSFEEPGQRPADRDGMREVCNTLATVPRADAAKGTWRFYADAARYLLDPVPYAVAKYRSAAYRERLEALLRRERFDIVVCDFLPPLVNMPTALPCPAVLFTHNVEAEIWRRHAENASNPVSRRLLRQQWHRMLQFEGSALRRFDLVLAVSDADARTFARLYPGTLRAPVHIVHTGVDTAYFSPAKAGHDDFRRAEPGQRDGARDGRSVGLQPDPHPHLVFTGSMDWLPNEDGMLFFVRDILPRIRAQEPAVTLSIVGRSPTPAVRRLAEQAGVDVTGRVEDVRPHVAAATVYVVPLRIGGGTRLKIFEAMAMAKAVVSTTIGAEGLPVTPGANIVLADEPEAFADAVVRLVRDRDERRRLETAARRLVVDRYDWSAVARDFEEAIEGACGACGTDRAEEEPATPLVGSL